MNWEEGDCWWGGRRGSQRDTLPILQFLPEAGPADWSPQRGKTKSQKKKVYCMERFDLTKEKERARSTGRHVFGHVPCLGKLTPARARIWWVCRKPFCPVSSEGPPGAFIDSLRALRRSTGTKSGVQGQVQAWTFIYSSVRSALSVGWKHKGEAMPWPQCTCHLETQYFSLKW